MAFRPRFAASRGERKLRTIDATCPLVTKVHLEAIRFAKEGYTIVLIGHEGHDEVIGTMGEAPAGDGAGRIAGGCRSAGRFRPMPEARLFDADDALGRRRQSDHRPAEDRGFPQRSSPPKEDICYATQNRQEAVRLLAGEADVVLVLGSQNSSNSQRLKELARESGVRLT